MGVWYDHNNNIEALSACDPDKPPGTCLDIRAVNAGLETALKDFCKSLFTDIIHLKAVTSRIGEIDARYTAFVTENTKGKCPYCGYGDIKGAHNTGCSKSSRRQTTSDSHANKYWITSSGLLASFRMPAPTFSRRRSSSPAETPT